MLYEAARDAAMLWQYFSPWSRCGTLAEGIATATVAFSLPQKTK